MRGTNYTASVTKYDYLGGTLSTAMTTFAATNPPPREVKTYMPPIMAAGYRINKKSGAYGRLTRAGFKLHDYLQLISDVKIMGVMECVCGRIETYALPLSFAKNGIIDVAADLERAGVISAAHLKKDRYSMEEIRRIRRQYMGI